MSIGRNRIYCGDLTDRTVKVEKSHDLPGFKVWEAQKASGVVLVQPGRPGEPGSQW